MPNAIQVQRNRSDVHQDLAQLYKPAALGIIFTSRRFGALAEVENAAAAAEV